MAKNKKYWKTLLASSSDKKHAAQTGEDPLEEGLKQLTWFESSKQAVRRGLNKTYETFGEEVGNSITSGVVVLYLLGLLPFAAINTYLRVTAEEGASQAHVIMSVIAISAFIVTLILALIMSTVYHLMKHGTPHKRVMNKVYRGIIPAEKVIAYINERDEFEIVQYRGVKKIEEIAPEGLSPDFEEFKARGALHSESESASDDYFDRWYSGHFSGDM